MKKIVFAGHDTALKLGIFTKAFRKRGYKVHSLAWYPNKFGSFCDEYIIDDAEKFQKGNAIKKGIVYLKYLARLFVLSFKYDVFFLNWATMVFEIIMLRLLGKRVYVIASGSDVRDYDLQELINVYYKKENDPHYYSRKKTKKNRRTAFFWGLFSNKIISTRDGLIPLHRVRNKTVDIIGYNFLEKSEVKNFKYFPEKKIRIVHAPSNKASKGTEFFRKAIKQLQEEGYHFDYVELTNVPNKKVLEELKIADIALCQINSGGIGTFAHEAMNNGCVIVAYVLEFVLKRYQLPVYNTNKEQVYLDLKRLLENPEKIIEFQKKSLKYFDKYIEENVALDEYIRKLDL